MDKKNDHKQDEYDFYREVMKKKPLDKRKIAVSAAGAVSYTHLDVYKRQYLE